ncbi:unnamed protein product [Rotaria socialis]|uniref:Uncharacterized protein n=1 Tax=Rotaria socialis TaxID=392032 RepID=A0A820P3P3_9BILA|nr:unnamed protein product [Rotaria socialis]CAF4398690.1 unnamed protein product [Rotaria socialis]
MKHLEKLILYLRICNGSSMSNKANPFLDGTHLHNEILIYMPQLRTFTFYISTENNIYNLPHPISTDNIQQTFANFKYGQTACAIDYFHTFRTICHVYSLSFTFTRLERISSKFPNIVFITVTHLHVNDFISLEHEFCMQISLAFPVLKRFCLKNETEQLWTDHITEPDENLSDSIIEYSHFRSFGLMCAHGHYISQFLLETKARLPCLTELKLKYGPLIAATRYFTIDALRRNCSKVNRLIVENCTRVPEDVYQYFPSL